MMLGLIIFGAVAVVAVAVVAVALYVRFAVDTIDGQDWMERQAR